MNYKRFRDVAQSGSALHWGCSGRRFKSGHPDHQFNIFFILLEAKNFNLRLEGIL